MWWGRRVLGKVALCMSFRQSLGNEATFLTGICFQHGSNINFLPVIDVVKSVFRIKEGMTEEEARKSN